MLYMFRKRPVALQRYGALIRSNPHRGREGRAACSQVRQVNDKQTTTTEYFYKTVLFKRINV